MLDALTQFGGSMSMSEAEAKFGVAKGTIGRWAKERREGRVVALKVAPRLPPLPAADPAPAPARGRLVSSVAASAANLTTEVRANLRDAVKKGVAYLANGPDIDPKGFQAAANGVRLILMATPDILTYEERTNAPSDRDALDDAAAVAAELRARRG